MYVCCNDKFNFILKEKLNKISEQILNGFKNKIVHPILTIIIPTFNEVNNISKIVEKLESALSTVKYKIIFVDDESNDGTINKIRLLEAQKSNISLLLRIGRRGLSGACIEGMLISKTELIAVIDCDLQHDEKKLSEMVNKFRANKNLDLVIGSRHTKHGRSEDGFNKFRKLGSDFAILLTKKLLRIQTTDPMSGFFMVKKNSLFQVIDKLQPNGFKILADIVACSNRTQKKWEIAEVGYEFKRRISGQSKMSIIIILEFLSLILSHLSRGILSIRFILFGMVGLSGVFVQLFTTFLCLNLSIQPYVTAHSIGVFMAMTSNYYFNNLLTYKDRSLKGFGFFKGLLSFYLICSAGALANIAIAKLFFDYTEIWVLSSLMGAILGAVWNFIFSSIFTWKAR